MMKTKNLFIVLSALLCLISCSDDDDNNGTTETAIHCDKQVTIVFDPGQLGDRGYADDILRGIQEYANGKGKEKVDLQFIALDDKEATVEQLAMWAKDRSNPFYPETDYKRRLLILTEPTQISWIYEKEIDEDDEILFLDSPQSWIDGIDAEGQEDHLHIINISAAASAEKFCRLYDQLREISNDTTMEDIITLRWHDWVVYQDSIDEAIVQHYGSSFLTNDLYLESMIEELYDEDSHNKLITTSYQLAGIFCNYAAPVAILSDLGTGNLGFDYYLNTHNNQTALTLLVDAEASDIANRFVIRRHFGRATADFIDRWTKSEVGAMPYIEWHGAWDGYCEDNIITF